MPGGIRIALAGNPNSGKTTLFNALTGARQSVGNYPGVTVEKKEGHVDLDGVRLHVVDLPGTYSLTAYTQEELVARDYLVNDRPHLVVDVLDANSLDRGLYLCVQFMEMGLPLMLALNMMDEVRKQGKRIDAALLSRLLDVPVVETVARVGEGKARLVTTAVETIRSRTAPRRPFQISYGPDLDPVILDMTALIEEERFLSNRPSRWLAVKYLEKDTQILSLGQRTDPVVSEKLMAAVDRIERHCLDTLNTTPEAIIADYRYGFIASITRRVVSLSDTRRDRIAVSDRIDRVLTHRLVGPLLMLSVLYGMFVVTFSVGEIPMAWVDALFSWLAEAANGVLPEGMLRSLVVDGIIGGVGGVLGFVPLIMIMFLGIAFLEDSGYMARMAYMMDRVLRVFGLHGCSVMPFIVAGGIPGGCAVPGVLGARTLRSPREKLATLLTAPFMPCGAKVPVFILLASAFFQESAATVLFWITLGSWAAALVMAWVLRHTVIRGESTPFVMELPPYRLPTLKGLLIHTWERAWQYMKKAGTVILAISVLVWAAMTFPSLPEADRTGFASRLAALETPTGTAASPEEAARVEAARKSLQAEEAQAALKASLAGRLGVALESVTQWSGFDWRTNIALIGGFAAKEVIVSTLGTAYSLGGVDPEDTGGLAGRLQSDPHWGPLTALALILFVMLYSPCFVTLVAISRESSWKWAVFSAVANTAGAFGLAVAVFQAGRLMGF